MNRYSMESVDGFIEVLSDDDGDWCRYEDVEKLLCGVEVVQCEPLLKGKPLAYDPGEPIVPEDEYKANFGNHPLECSCVECFKSVEKHYE